MIPVTDAYKSSIYATSRTMYGRLEFELLDVDAYSDASATVTGEAPISKKSQMFNLIRDMTAKYATLENDYWKLDGSFSLPPKVTETGYEVGWWSNEISGSDCMFGTAQVVTVTFTADQSSIGLTITFDSIANEYAKDFEIVVYDSVDAVIHTEAVTDNVLSKYILEENLADFRKITITITKTATAYRRARITEIDFGIIREYDGNDLITMNIVEDIDTTSNTISTNEMSFTLNNQNKDFNILNPVGVYPFLQRRQRLKPFIGLKITDTLTEYVPLGIYYLTEWKSDEGTLTATFKARDLLDFLAQDTFTETVYSSKTLTYILEDIFNKAGITDYEIDSALDSITVSGTLAESTYREALQTVAIAGMSVGYVDRSGIIQIKQLTTPTSVDTIDFDNVYSAPKIELNKLINTVYVEYGASIHTLVDPAKLASEQTFAVTISNPLISTLAHAEDIADWILGEYQKRFLYEINWRQNPALECGDIVTVEDDFSEDKTMRITKQEFTFQGYLGGKTNGKGSGT